MASLSGGQRQTVAIARAVIWNSKLVVLDEPTAALGVAQTEQVLRLVRQLADNGLAVVLISHNLNDVFQVADRISVLYLGRMAAHVKKADVKSNQVVELITTGRSGDIGLRAEGETNDVPERASAHARGRPPDDDRRGGQVTAPVVTSDAGRRRRRRRATRSPRRSRNYVAKVRGGDVGSLPAVLGLIVLVIVFTALRPETFTNAFNFANLIHQAAAVIIIAMGLVFVLLLGEIDLSAGYAAGTAAAVMGIVSTNWGWPWYLGDPRLPGHRRGDRRVHRCAGGPAGHPVVRRDAGGVPGLQGVLLQLIGEGGTIPIRDSTLLAINNNDMPVWLGWVLYAVVVGRLRGRRAAARRRAAQDAACQYEATAGHHLQDRHAGACCSARRPTT